MNFSLIKDNTIRFMHKNRKFLCIFAVLLILSIAAIVFVSNDHFLYSTPIAKIIEIDETVDHVEYGRDDSQEDYYLQNITAVLLNGAKKGSTITLSNIRSESNVYDTRYYVGDQVFLKDGQDSLEISDVKRDTFVVSLLVLTFLILVLVGKIKGLLSFISVAFNATVFWFALKFYEPGKNIFFISILVTILFIILCLTIIGGFSKKTLMAVLCTFIGTLVSFGIAFIVILIFDYSGVYVESLEFLVVEIDYRRIFLSEILVGGLGSTMDIAMSMSASLCELKRKDSNISRSALLRSGKEIGKDITGTMTNVLLFTYLCGTIPLMMVIVKGGMPLQNYIMHNCTLEITRFLCGSLGIVLTVPISYVICSYLLSKKRRGDK